ncbi:MAG: TonB-dependent receptor plug domain-containing protein, partial [Bacteroidales bacterium]|nr:TonB-dependent receptor plug domain-containing protein [Bacteroidales bacterium]
MKKNKSQGKTFFSTPKKLFPVLLTVVFLIFLGTPQIKAADTYSQGTGVVADFSDATLIKDSDAGLYASPQQQVISGTVIDIHTREPMPGVNIVEKGTTIGTITDLGGRYSFSVTGPNAVIVVSFIGYNPEEVAVAGRSVVDIQMTPSIESLDEVVVTALGIQREKKTLTYSSQQVAGAEMMRARDINFMNALSGKTAGLEIKKAASGAGGSTRTVLRGSKSFSGTSAPLYVIDGVPITNRVGGQAGLWGGYDEGDGISQLNPDDIESISLLKGDNAAILYVSQGANGVVIITTLKR